MKTTNVKNTNRGITLIALVITIIVMLILVAVTINMAINGGLFSHAGKAVGDTENALNEEKNLASGGIVVDGIAYETIQDYLDGYPAPTIKISLEIKGTRKNDVQIPEGFEYKEGTIDTGYVVINKTDGNEFVWVPVDSNPKISLKVTSEKDIKEIKMYDPQNNEILKIVDGDVEETYNIDVIPTINGCYYVTAESEDDYISEELWFYGIYKKNAAYDDLEDYTESVYKNGGFYVGRYEAGAIKPRTSGNADDTVVKIIEDNGMPVCKEGAYPYNNVTFDQALGLTKAMYDDSNFTVSLMSGAGWDLVLGWFDMHGDGTLWGNYTSASNFEIIKGEYSEDEGFTYTKVSEKYLKNEGKCAILTTGATDKFKVKGIFDFAGNVDEWTLETDNKNNFMQRGGMWGNIGSQPWMPTRYYISPRNETNAHIGFRPVIYLK